MIKKKRFYLGLAITILLAANAYILLHRNDGYRYYPFKSYTELYVTDSTLYLQDIFFDKDSVKCTFSQNIQQHDELETWETFADDSTHLGFAKANLNTITFKLLKGIHHYNLVSIVTKKEIGFEIDHNFANNQYVNELTFCSLPGPRIEVGKLNTWSNVHQTFSKEDENFGRKILQDSTKIFTKENDFDKTLELSKFILKLNSNCKGIYAYKLSEYTPAKQLEMALQGNADLACGNYAAIIHYLANIANLPNRIVTFRGPAGNWTYGVHYYNEVYLRDKQQWALLGALSKSIMPFDSTTHQFINAVTLNELVKTHSTEEKLSYTFKGDSLMILPYDSLNKIHHYYNQSNAFIAFLKDNANEQKNGFQKLLEFYSFTSDEDYFSLEYRNNWKKIFLKEAALFLLLLFIFYYLKMELFQRIEKRKEH